MRNTLLRLIPLLLILVLILIHNTSLSSANEQPVSTMAPTESDIDYITPAPLDNVDSILTTETPILPSITPEPTAVVCQTPTPWPDNIKVKHPGKLSYSILSKSSIKLEWNRCSKVDGYIIYRKEDEGTYNKIKKITRNALVSYTDNNLVYNTCYTYKVCSYKIIDGETYITDSDKNAVSIILKFKSKYKKGYKLYYDNNGQLITDVEGIIGKQNSYVIKVNTEQCVVTVYAKDGNKGYTIPVKSFICSPGTNTKSGTFNSSTRYRYRVLFFNSYSQWTVRIHGNILFHTSTYLKYKDKTSFDPAEYNKLGTPASHGCIRLQCEGAKWMYDNCKYGTKVIIYKSKNPGPFGKPEYQKLPKWHTWDPTDPTCKSLCKKKNCH